MIERRVISSMILYGPSGTGKTTIARLLAVATDLEFEAVSAIQSGVSELRKLFEAAKERRAVGRGTILFCDEIHRFNRAQQDAFLPYVEDGTITLVGATTENPSFALNGALLSRCSVFVLHALDSTALELLIQRAERHVGREVPLTTDARLAMVELATGDGRYLLNLVEQVFTHVGDVLSTAELGLLLQRRVPTHDRAGDGHYDLLSAFHKSLRGSDADAALYYAARMLIGGEAPDAIFRRLICAASEDVGTADPQAMPQVLSAWQAFERVGLPEGRLFIAQAICYVATAPKSNAAYLAFTSALQLAERTSHLGPPLATLNAPTKMMKDLSYGEGYRYDHDEPHAHAGQEFFPDAISGNSRPTFFLPHERGYEREIRKRLDFWRSRRASRAQQVLPDEA
jgi:putative ATPase